MQQRCRMLAVEKYTSKLFHTSHMNGPNNHLFRDRVEMMRLFRK
ncbi:hypothetical protein pipiens_019446, partial [Culex pipiens pipiens]